MRPVTAVTLGVLVVVLVSTAVLMQSIPLWTELRSVSSKTADTQQVWALNCQSNSTTGPVDPNGSVAPFPGEENSFTACAVHPDFLSALTTPLVEVDDLRPCTGDRPPELLCRPTPGMSVARDEYIRRLRITDPYFYDMFEDNEVFKLFKPRPTVPELELVSHDHNALLIKPYRQHGVRQAIQRYQAYDGESSWFYAYWTGPHRVEEHTSEKGKLKLDYVPFPISHADKLHKPNDKDDDSPAIIADYLKNITVVESKYPQQNSFSIVSDTSGFNTLLTHSEAVFNNEADPSSPTWSELPLRSTIMTYATQPLTAPCQVVVGGMPIVRLRLNRSFPAGGVPSYQYAMGALAHLVDTRPYHIWSMPQWNQSLHYQSKVAQGLARKFRPSALTGSNLDEDLPECPRGHVEGCRIGFDQFHMDTYTYTLSRSRFGLILPETENRASPRLMDVIAAGLIPVIVFRDIAAFSLPGQCFVPWRQLAIWIDEAEFSLDPEAAIRKHVLGQSSRDLEKLLRLQEYYRPLILLALYETDAPYLRGLEIAHSCLPEAYLVQTQGISKTMMPCDFEDFTAAPAFPTYSDEDDEPVWNSAWFAPITEVRLQA
eukprot:Protomagalhaensia_sp_Gyna_25__585@NODE_1276_length_1990_cov_18_768324_g1018_i0_p1_GENE_NODE_1276_length_1990_cov_18_768324_g1018_i0NODE_1276_length_1990_cov_18_768324_g1018_i0_p1_ORF_typecomplete_len599_score75_46Exostosin/PF03016_15/5_9e10_NODE_1276_length_1990_cov_18_768324_g1018_i0631859